MRSLMLSTGVPVAVAIVGIVLVSTWMRTGPADGLVRRVPGMDGSDALIGGRVLETPVAGEPRVFDVEPSDIPGSWPWFRGPEGDGIRRESVPLARKWPDEGPEVLWTVEMGPGHAGAAVWAGRVYVLDYDTEAQADTMRCLSLDDGREIWRNGYPVVIEHDHGMSRTVPAVTDGLVISIGPLCHVACWDATNGECRWLLDLVNQYKTIVPQWNAGQCPLIDDGRLILAPSGTALMIAVDCRSGEVLWESPELENWEMTHASILPVDFQGKRMYVYNASRGVAGVSAEDGSLLWKTTDWIGSKTATCPTPVDVGDGRIFFSAGYNAGSAMLQLEGGQDAFVSKTLFRLKARQFESEQHTPVLFDGHLYGVRTNPGGKQLACFDLEGNELWNSGTDKFERGPYLVADGLLYVMADDGLLTVAEATSTAYKPLDQFQTLGRAHHAWAPMALVGGRLILRDLTRMTCLDISDN